LYRKFAFQKYESASTIYKICNTKNISDLLTRAKDNKCANIFYNLFEKKVDMFNVPPEHVYEAIMEFILTKEYINPIDSPHLIKTVSITGDRLNKVVFRQKIPSTAVKLSGYTTVENKQNYPILREQIIKTLEALKKVNIDYGSLTPEGLLVNEEKDGNIQILFYDYSHTKQYGKTDQDNLPALLEFLTMPKQTKIIELVPAKNTYYIIHPIIMMDGIPLIFNATNPTGDILTKLKSIYSKNRWVSSYSSSTYIYIMNTNDDIISVVSINNNTNELRDDTTDPLYRRLGLYKILCNERVKYVTKNFNLNTIYNLYTEHDYLMPTHCNSGLYLASNTKQRVPRDSDPTLYWHFTTFMTDENILNRIHEEHIIDSIIHIRDCVATSIGNNNIISAMHCSERVGSNDHSYDKMTNVKNEYFIQNICSDGNTNNSDIVIYEKNDMPHQALTPLIWNPRDTTVFFNNMCIRFIVFNKYTNEFSVLDTYNNIFEIETGAENGCHTITFNFGPKLHQGNSGGPLIIYIGNRFYIIGVLSDGSNKFKLYSLFCSLFNKNTLNMYSSFNFNRSGYNFIDIIRDDIKEQIYNNFIRFTVNDRKIMIHID
jgi:hypothetical protein